MNFQQAMAIVDGGGAVRRGARQVRGVKGPSGFIAMNEHHGVFLANPVEEAATDWEEISPDAPKSARGKSAPAADANAKPIDGGDGATAPDGAQGNEKQTVGVNTPAGSAAVEGPASIQKIVKNGRRAAKAGRVQKG